VKLALTIGMVLVQYVPEWQVLTRDEHLAASSLAILWLPRAFWLCIRAALAISFLSGSLRFRLIALIMQLFSVVASAGTMVFRHRMGKVPVTMEEVVLEILGTGALLVLLTGTPNSRRLKLGVCLICAWLVMSVLAFAGASTAHPIGRLR